MPPSDASKFVVHAVWVRGAIHVWAESLALAHEPQSQSHASTADLIRAHPFACTAEATRQRLLESGALRDGDVAALGTISLPLPHRIHQATPLPSGRLGTLLGITIGDDEPLHLESAQTPAIALTGPGALRFFLGVQDAAEQNGESLELGQPMRWWIALAQLALELLVDQRIVPSLTQQRDGLLRGCWQPWLHESSTQSRLQAILASTPAVVRAAADTGGTTAWPIVDAFLSGVVDSFVRSELGAESYIDALEGRNADTDPNAAWLAGLLDGTPEVRQPARSETPLLRGARDWLGGLADVTDQNPLRLRLELSEPDVHDETPDARWRLHFALASHDSSTILTAPAVWAQSTGRRGARSAQRGEELGELLVRELGRASRVWPRLEDALEESAPTDLSLDTKDAYAFLSEFAPILVESGFDVSLPDWWGAPTSRLGARLMVQPTTGVDGSPQSGATLGLAALVDCKWQISLGDTPLTLNAFEHLAKGGAPLVKLNGKWAEIRPEDFESAARFLREHAGGTMTLLEALRLAHGIDGPVGGLAVRGLEASGWVSEIFDAREKAEALQSVAQPSGFQGTLRPYQAAGLAWLAFLSRHRLGACLADDMGLGKTIQLIALLLHEREVDQGQPIGPTLLVAPMSVLGNWERELTRFAPTLRVHRHHGLERPTGERFLEIARSSDIVVTTYALVVRDRETLAKLEWHRIVLDEAQHIKNPPTKQTSSIRSLKAHHRVALTGTPVENRLTELWSILEFCCPGYLGAQASFRRNFALPIERHRDRARADRLRAIVRPIVLRRLKTDPRIISDLPPLIEGREHVALTNEQARLYEQVVAEMLARVDASEGIRRRGLVLSALVKLKQICNHPGHFLREGAEDHPDVDAPSDAAELDAAAEQARAVAQAASAGERMSDRSGKTQRLTEMLEELLAAGDRALVFTQYRQMGHLLVALLRRELDTEALFLHGGTPQAKRDALVDRFQSGDPRAPVFILSLKAGGLGLNLTSANHVFHFDRWWNPAVESQATDRAFRIGQTRTVHVHKFICAGTLEERIDQMIEQKTELATNIIGSGDSWLSDLTTTQLRDIVTLRRSALEDGTT